MDKYELQELIDQHLHVGNDIVRVTSFQENGVLSDDAGLVLTMHDGSTIYLTIQRKHW